LRATTLESMRAISTTRSGASSSSRRSGFAAVCLVDDFALTLAERRLFQALNERGVRHVLLGMSAALLEGAPSTANLFRLPNGRIHNLSRALHHDPHDL
jgi:hypothetical protein